MAKKGETLEEGLNKSANKRGFTGKERHRYIGGALHNMGKAKPRRKGDSKNPSARESSTTHHTAHKTVQHHKPEPVKPTRPKEQIVLTAKLNSVASKGKPYNVYSIYKGKELWSKTTYRKLSTAKAEAKIEQDAHNYGYKRGRF